MNFDEMAEKVLEKFPLDKVAKAEKRSMKILRKVAIEAMAKAAENLAPLSSYGAPLYGDARVGVFFASATRGRRPDCAIRGLNAFNEDLLTLDLYYSPFLYRTHIASAEPRRD